MAALFSTPWDPLGNWRGQLLEKPECHTGAYLTHLNDSGESLSGYDYDTPPDGRRVKFGRIKNQRWRDSSGTLLAGRACST